MEIDFNDTLYQVCRKLNNFFVSVPETRIVKVDDGEINEEIPEDAFVNFILLQRFGMYRYSVLDGLHLEDVPDEYKNIAKVKINFCHVPRNFIALINDIIEFQKSDAAKPTNVKSETISNVYSVTRGTNDNGMVAGWEDVFASRLSEFKRTFTGLR